RLTGRDAPAAHRGGRIASGAAYIQIAVFIADHIVVAVVAHTGQRTAVRTLQRTEAGARVFAFQQRTLLATGQQTLTARSGRYIIDTSHAQWRGLQPVAARLVQDTAFVATAQHRGGCTVEHLKARYVQTALQRPVCTVVAM